MVNIVYVYEAPITKLDPVLSTLQVPVHLILTTASEEGIHYQHFTDEEIKAQWD